MSEQLVKLVKRNRGRILILTLLLIHPPLLHLQPPSVIRLTLGQLSYEMKCVLHAMCIHTILCDNELVN